MFFPKVIFFYEFLEVTFQKICVFSLGEPRGTEGKTKRLERVSFHIGIRTLLCKSIFRDKMKTHTFCWSACDLRLPVRWPAAFPSSVDCSIRHNQTEARSASAGVGSGSVANKSIPAALLSTTCATDFCTASPKMAHHLC